VRLVIIFLVVIFSS